MENMKNIRMEEVCNFLKNIIKVLSKPRRIVILNVLLNDGECTFKEIQNKIEISTGSLHGHLEALLESRVYL